MNTLLRIALTGVYVLIVLALIIVIALILTTYLPLALTLVAGLLCGYLLGPLVFLGFEVIEECIFALSSPTSTDREYVVHEESD